MSSRTTSAVVFKILLFAALFSLSLDALPQRRAANRRAATREDSREDAYRANNLGVALLEQYKHREGAAEFRRALSIDPRLALARTNLAIALFNVPDADAARREAEGAARLSPEAPQPHYILGLIAKQENRADDALAEFARVLAVDPRDVGTNINIGQLHLQRREFAEAAARFRVAVEEEPYNGTAVYNLATVLLRSGSRDEGQRLMTRFQQLRESGAATTIGQSYLEQGRYAVAVTSTGAEPGLVDKRTPAVSFTDVTAGVLPKSSRPWPFKNGGAEKSSGAVVLFDFDNDGDLDLLEVASTAQRLYRNDGGRFTDVTAQSGALASEAAGVGTAAVAGDYDNDGRADLFILREGSASALYRNEGGGRFADVTRAAKLSIDSYPYISAAFVDCDHDGDLDIFVAGGSADSPFGPPSFDTKKADEAKADGTRAVKPEMFNLFVPVASNLLLRNNGDGTFTDRTRESNLMDAGTAFAVVPTDYDDRRDVDLLVVEHDKVTLRRNMRDGTFRDVAPEVGLKFEESLNGTSVAAGDVNKDGFTDFYFGRGAQEGYFALSDGRARFRIKRGPDPLEGRSSPRAVRSDEASMFLDYDNDGLLDLVSLLTVSVDGTGDPHLELSVRRNTGDGWTDVSARAARGLRAEIGRTGTQLSRRRVLAAGDLDGDGDTDLVFGVAGGGLRVARNDGGNRNRSLRVALAGKVSNRGGVGAKIEVRAGSLQQRVETYAASPSPAPADVLFGLGRRASADAVRVLWPSGVVQSETEPKPNTAARAETNALKVTELDRKPSSCPYLYAWDGSRFGFITDFMGGGETGDWVAPGVYSTPDPDEYVRISGDRLKERDGRYELRVTNELEEALFVDRVQLVAVSHPAGVEVYPNEGLGNPTGPAFKLYATRDARTPLAATDEHGHDVLARVARLDRKYPDDFKLLPIRGYAAEHTLTLDLGKDEGGKIKDEVGAVRPSASPSSASASSFVSRPSSSMLLLTGWTDYAFSSDNVAASQRGFEMRPPALQVKDEEGKWRTVIENVGFPVGRPQTIAVDLAGKFLSSSREVRIVTTMRIYWDQVLVAERAGDEDAPRVERLEASVAALRERGFSAEVSEDGREPFSYDYARVSLASPWKAFTGRYTRTGDVRELLLKTDDMFVVSKPGDELALSFDAASLSPLPAGWTRTFLLYADGFSKEMDINSASPHEVAPMPFHAMTRYPYAAPESYPQDDAHRSYLERYNTRVVASPLPALVARGE